MRMYFQFPSLKMCNTYVCINARIRLQADNNVAASSLLLQVHCSVFSKDIGNFFTYYLLTCR